MDTGSIQKQEAFDIWKSEIQKRINDWKNTLLEEGQNLKLDYSQKSLIDLERYLTANYSLKSLENKKHNKELDACASYIGESMLKLIPHSKWHIYLDDMSNVYYGLPCIKTLYSGSISVHHLLREILTENDGEVLKKRIEKVSTYEKTINEQLKSKS